jgi:hypothetical protein
MGANTSPPVFGGSDVQGPRVPGPLGVVDTVRTSLRLYGADAVKLWQVMALVIIPLQVLIFVLRAISVPSGSVLHNANIYVPDNSGGAFVALSELADVLTALVLLVSIGAAYRILLGRYLHHPADLSASFNFGLERLAPLLWVSIVTAVVVLIGFLLIIIPGIYLLVCVSIAVPVLMAEDRRGLNALTRSRELVSGSWWHVLGCTLVAAIVAGVGEVVIGVLVGAITSAVSPHSITVFLLINGVLNALVSILFSPFTAAVPVVVYVDMLVRKNDPQLGRLLA